MHFGGTAAVMRRSCTACVGRAPTVYCVGGARALVVSVTGAMQVPDHPPSDDRSAAHDGQG